MKILIMSCSLFCDFIIRVPSCQMDTVNQTVVYKVSFLISTQCSKSERVFTVFPLFLCVCTYVRELTPLDIHPAVYRSSGHWHCHDLQHVHYEWLEDYGFLFPICGRT
jgi:hypothetical protein